MIRATHGACTHIGQVRRDNEDAYVAIDGLYMVADGMGGHSAGEVASALTVATLKDIYLLSSQVVNDLNQVSTDENPVKDLVVDDRVVDHRVSDFPSTKPGLRSPEQVAEAIALANTAVFLEALDDTSKSGMGTTLTGIVVTAPENNSIVVANVGDSRTYLWRGGELLQITKDHSHVQTLVDRGAITQAEARVHYQRNIVLRAIGIDAEVHVDLFPLTVENGDRFIMCSDGLVDEADDDEIINEIRLRGQPQDLAERLVQLANDNGGRDNITVIVVDFEVTESHETRSHETRSHGTQDTSTTETSNSATSTTETSNSATSTTETGISATSNTETSISATSDGVTRRTLVTRARSLIRSSIRSLARSSIRSLFRDRRAPVVATVAALVTVIAVIIAIISSL